MGNLTSPRLHPPPKQGQASRRATWSPTGTALSVQLPRAGNAKASAKNTGFVPRQSMADYEKIIQRSTFIPPLQEAVPGSSRNTSRRTRQLWHPVAIRVSLVLNADRNQKNRVEGLITHLLKPRTQGEARARSYPQAAHPQCHPCVLEPDTNPSAQ